MTWAQFILKVYEFLHIAGKRRGIDAFRAAYISHAVRDLKRFVCAYQDGKTTYQNADQTPFNENTAEAVAAYAASKIARVVDHDFELEDRHWKDYLISRRALFLGDKEPADTCHDIFQIKKGDTLPILQATLTDEGQIVDLDGATVEFIFAGVSGCCVKEIFRRSATIANAAGGVVSYAWQEGDTDITGTFLGEFKATLGDETWTFPTKGFIEIEILPSM